MSSPRRIASSRANGARSKGPVTPAGKARSSQNAITHGFFAARVVLANESHEDFQRLLAALGQRFAPADAVESSLVEEMAAALWRQRRAWSIETSLTHEAIDKQFEWEESDDDIADAGDATLARAFVRLANGGQLQVLYRHEARLNVMFQRALRNLLLLRRTTPLPDAPACPENLEDPPEPSAPAACGPDHIPAPAPESPAAPACSAGPGQTPCAPAHVAPEPAGTETGIPGAIPNPRSVCPPRRAPVSTPGHSRRHTFPRRASGGRPGQRPVTAGRLPAQITRCTNAPAAPAAMASTPAAYCPEMGLGSFRTFRVRPLAPVSSPSRRVPAGGLPPVLFASTPRLRPFPPPAAKGGNA